MLKFNQLFKFLFSIFLLLLISCTTRDNKPSANQGKPGDELKITPELNYLLKPANAMVISGIRTMVPIQKSMDISIQANGIITYDTRRFTSVPVRFAGRIEKLLVKYNFQPIVKGQKILEIYSPELVTVQRDLLYLLKSDAENTQLIEGAKEKLRLLGVSDIQINQLVATGKESYSFAVFSPVNGYVVEDAALTAITTSGQPTSPVMDGGMLPSNAKETATPQTRAELQTREGMYLNAGQVIFKVINTDQVWAEFDVYQRDAAMVKVNDPVRLTMDNTPETEKARVNFIQPFIRNGERFIKVRVYLSNPGKKFSIGQLITASFAAPASDVLWIPQSAMLDLGEKEIVFTKRRGVFRPKEIVTARKSDEWVEIVSGLEKNDSIAYNARFMVDSESFIKVRN